MKKIFTLSAFLYFTNCLLGQQLPINVSYFGENGLHSGLKLGVEKSIFEKEKTKDRWFENRNSKIGSKTKIRNVVLSPSVGFYNHANNHTGLFLNAEFLYRRTKTRRGFYYDAGFGLGYLQRIYNIPTYELGSGTEPYQFTLAGQAQFMPTIFAAFGQNLFYRKEINIGWFVKPQLMFLMPYGFTSVLNPALEIGVKYLWDFKKAKQ